MAVSAQPGARERTVRDSAGRDVRVPAQVRRVFPAGPPAAILLYTLAPELMLGWPRANRPEECALLRADICRRPELGRLTGRGNTANLEVVLATRPDLIVDSGSTSGTFVSLATRVQEQTGILYALLDGRFEAIPDTYRMLGRIVGRQERAEQLARYAEETLATVRSRVARVPESARPKVYYARGPRGLETGLGGSINVETIAFLGARNVAAERQGGLALVSMEQVLRWDPEVIVTIDRDFARDVRSSPLWASVSAVREGRVHLSPKLPFGWVDFPPSVNRLIGLWWLGRIFYPELFPEGVAARAREFYRLFYHVDPSDAQLAVVLEGRGPIGP